MSAGAAVEVGVSVAELVRCDAAVVDELIESFRECARRDAIRLSKLVAVSDATPVLEYAPLEVSCAWALTRQAATAQLDLAVDIVRRLPDVHAAMARGDIDLPRARVIRDCVAAVPTALARRIAADVLPTVLTLTTGRLRTRLAKLVIAADPAAAARAHQARIRQRRVVVQPGEDSCAHVLGLDLPADKAVAAAERIAALARVVKQAGDPRSMDQIRADTFLNLLLGHPTAGESRARGRVELIADLAGLAEHPGHLNGYGPVIADIARQVAAQQHDTPWTFTIYDNATGDIHTGTTRTRPAPNPPASQPPTPAAHQPGPDDPTSPPNHDRVGHPANTAQARQPANASRPGHPANTGRHGQPANTGRPSQPANADRPSQSANTGRPGQPANADRPGQSANTGRLGQPPNADHPGQPPNTDRTGQPANADRPGQPANTGRPGQPANADRPASQQTPTARVNRQKAGTRIGRHQVAVRAVRIVLAPRASPGGLAAPAIGTKPGPRARRLQPARASRSRPQRLAPNLATRRQPARAAKLPKPPNPVGCSEIRTGGFLMLRLRGTSARVIARAVRRAAVGLPASPISITPSPMRRAGAPCAKI